MLSAFSFSGINISKNSAGHIYRYLPPIDIPIKTTKMIVGVMMRALVEQLEGPTQTEKQPALTQN